MFLRFFRVLLAQAIPFLPDAINAIAGTALPLIPPPWNFVAGAALNAIGKAVRDYGKGAWNWVPV